MVATVFALAIIALGYVLLTEVRSRQVLFPMLAVAFMASPILLRQPLSMLGVWLATVPTEALVRGFWITFALAGPTILLWTGLARWASRDPAPPLADSAQLRWNPRSSHRPTWVLLGVLVMALTIPAFTSGDFLFAMFPPLLWGTAWTWGHQGNRGGIRLTTTTLYLGEDRVDLVNVQEVDREVKFIGPIRRERIRIKHRQGEIRHLISGSPQEDAEVFLALFQRQHKLASTVEVGPVLAIPSPLQSLLQKAGSPADHPRAVDVAMGPNGPSPQETAPR